MSIVVLDCGYPKLSLNCALLNGWSNRLYAAGFSKPLASSPQHGHEGRACELAACTGEPESAAEDQGGQGRSTSQTKTHPFPNMPDFYGFLFVKCEFQECAELW